MYLKNARYKGDLDNAFLGIVNAEKLYHKRILITGATGLIGSFMVDLLLYINQIKNAGIEIYILARDEKKVRKRFASNLGEKRLHCVFQDVINPIKLSVAVDYIIHAAGDSFPSAFQKHPVETMTPALFGTYQLLQYAMESKITKFLYVSSGEVYGRMVESSGAFTEKECGYLDSMDKRSCYPMSKRCAETLCVSFGEEYGIPICVTRPSHTYGVCVSANDNRATAQFLECAVSKKTIILHSEGKQMRSYTYVADCVSGMLTVLLNGVNGEAYNLANSNSRITILNFAQILAYKAGVECIIKTPNKCERKEHSPIEYAVLDSSKLENLGWMGKYDIYKGIESMLEIRQWIDS